MTVTTVLSLCLVQFVSLDFMCIMVEVLLHRASAIGHASGPQLVNDAQYDGLIKPFFKTSTNGSS